MVRLHLKVTAVKRYSRSRRPLDIQSPVLLRKTDRYDDCRKTRGKDER